MLNSFQIGIDVKTKHAEELTETVEITEEVDEEQEIQDEVKLYHYIYIY